MIDAAEAIVADRGLAAMSLREVQARAGQLNKNAAQYYFGNREGLIAAVVETRMAPIDAARGQLLAELDGKKLVRIVAEQALASKASEVIVVTGHQAEDVRALIDGGDENPHLVQGQRVDHARLLSAVLMKIISF